MPKMQELDTRISLLQNDFKNIEKYFQKLDNTVEKITELTSSMNRMIILHEERIVVQSKDDEELRKLIENRRIATEKGFELLSEKIDKANSRLWKLDLKRGTMVGAIIMLAFIVGPILSGFFQAYYQKLIH